MEQAITVNLTVQRPYMTFDEYGKALGVSADTVRGWAQNNYIHVKKIGKRVFVNNMAESIEAAAAAQAARVFAGGAE
ncbi:hypothetical protein [Oceanobacter sp. 3_MG-2023]|uniref:hypothetical protein n=1 Tax=Oceanobacter sp. 3_MG-2023 TaxID=3062622 RepID=UPI002732A6AD|nr:hypothetical protein [Oceanobacter sp. 3_MG-2023]MDP2505632.1 hypothetical protein [Oceanobacter sp. 3_MG-2023]